MLRRECAEGIRKEKTTKAGDVGPGSRRKERAPSIRHRGKARPRAPHVLLPHGERSGGGSYLPAANVCLLSLFLSSSIYSKSYIYTFISTATVARLRNGFTTELDAHNSLLSSITKSKEREKPPPLQCPPSLLATTGGWSGRI